MSQSSPSSRSKRPTAAAFRDVVRRLDAIERRLTSRSTEPAYRPSDLMRRWDILDEERLRGQIARDGALRRDDLTEWKNREKRRLARNRETVAVNRRLRAEGLRPIELEPSFAQRVKKLKQLEAGNRARTATRKTRA